MRTALALGAAGLLWAASALAQTSPAQVSPNGVKSIGPPPGVPAPVGTWALGARAGDFVFLAGVQGVDPVTKKLVADPETRVRQAFANIRAIAQSEGATLADCVRITIYVSDLGKAVPMVEKVQGELWGKGPYPPRTMVEVRRLFDDDLIEIDSVFYAPAKAK